jgi:hypothetical protein
MSQLNQFDRRYDYQYITWAVFCIKGLLDFDVKEVINPQDLIECKVYERNFWGSNKLKGYFKLSPIHDNIDEPLIRFEFQCVYGTYKSHNFWGGDRTEIFNYDFFMSSINASLGIHQEVITDEPIYDDVNLGLQQLNDKVHNLKHHNNLAGIKSMLEEFKFPNVK